MGETCLKGLQSTRGWVNKGRPSFVNQSISQNYARNAEWQNERRNSRRVELERGTSSPSMTATASYSGWPRPCHLVWPFNSLVVAHAMMLLVFYDLARLSDG